MDADRRSDCNMPPHGSPSGSASLVPLGEVDYVGNREVSNMTRHVPYDEFRKDPAKYMDEAGGEPLRIDREAGSVVMISEDEFEGWKETIHLLSSPTNASRLLSALAPAEAGELEEHELIEK
jgi:antitoxin YefM